MIAGVVLLVTGLVMGGTGIALHADEQAPTEGELVSVFPVPAEFKWMDARVSSLRCGPLRS